MVTHLCNNESYNELKENISEMRGFLYGLQHSNSNVLPFDEWIKNLDLIIEILNQKQLNLNMTTKEKINKICDHLVVREHKKREKTIVNRVKKFLEDTKND